MAIYLSILGVLTVVAWSGAIWQIIREPRRTGHGLLIVGCLYAGNPTHRPPGTPTKRLYFRSADSERHALSSTSALSIPRLRVLPVAPLGS